MTKQKKSVSFNLYDNEIAKALKARNRPTFAYTDREINAVNRARNIAAGYKFFINDKGEESGILLTENNEPLGNGDIKTIIEMPACAVDQGSPIGLFLEAQLEHLKKFQERKTHSVYPVKILFPYKLKAWHWNVGEVKVTQEDGKLVLEGCAYDSMNREADLELKIQQEILDTFKASFPGKNFTENHLNRKSVSNKAPQKGGIACGLYAGLAMHNLKTKSSEQVWDGAYEKYEQTLRNEDSDLVSKYNPNSRFCEAINERGFVDIFKTAGTTSSNPTLSKKGSEKTPYLNMAEQLKKIKADKLKDIAALAESLAFTKYPKDKAYKQLFEKLKDNITLQSIIFPNGDKSRTITNEQLANLAFEATLIASTSEISPNPTPEETAYQHCIEIISGSFADAIRDCAIRSPSPLVDYSSKKATDVTDEKVAIKSFSEGLQRHIYNTFKKFEDSEKNTKSINDLLEISDLVARMICLEVQETRISEIAKMKSNTQSTPLSEEAKLLIDNFVRSNNPILEKDGKNYTPLEAAKEKFKAVLKKKSGENEEGSERESTATEAVNPKIDNDMLEFFAKSILGKALKANSICHKDKVSKIEFSSQVGTGENETLEKEEKLTIHFGNRYVRKDFSGQKDEKLKFADSNFGNNSFANCTFTNCDFTGSSGKQLKFVNCTFGEGCVIPKDLKTLKMNFAGCKFNEKIFARMENADHLKTKLGIPTEAEAENGFYQSEKPSASISSGAAFKLNTQMLTR